MVDPILRAASWLITVDSTNMAEVAVTRFALASIYYNNQGNQWTDKTNWLSEKSHCEWKGVTCCSKVPSYLGCSKSNGQDLVKVVELDLSNNQLMGYIPVGISLLKDLESMILSYNNLTGAIPKVVIKSLPKISQIYLSHNKLSGTIPLGLDSDSLGKGPMDGWTVDLWQREFLFFNTNSHTPIPPSLQYFFICCRYDIFARE
jgi:hypothetical protein